MQVLTRADVIRKCIILFESLKRVASKGGAGLEPAQGADEEFWMDEECLNILRHMMQEMEAGQEKQQEWKNWQLEMQDGPPERLVL